MKILKFGLIASAVLSVGLLPACAPEQSTTVQMVSENHTSSLDPQRPAAMEVMANALRDQLDEEVVGFAFVLHDIETDRVLSHAEGLARLSGDGGPLEMSADRRMITASVSKWVSALGTLAVLDDQGLPADTAIGPYFPSDWDVDAYLRSVSFGQLLSQTSGIKDFGNGVKDYALLQAFFTQPVHGEADTGCDGPWVETPQFGVTPNDQAYCYSNYNAGILQILLPRLAGFDEDPDLQTRPATLARQFERLIQAHVFEPVGVSNATCAPQEADYALSYIFPGQAPGQDWGSQYDRCATGGWYVSPRGLAAVTASIARRDGRILPETGLDVVQARGFGLDRNTPEMIEKSGVLGNDPGVLSASVMIRFDAYQAPHLVAVLYINSTTSQIQIAHARPILVQAYEAAFAQGVTPE